jgi:hypothetical protein
MPKNSSTRETAPEMPAAKSGRAPSRRPPGVSGEGPVRPSHAEFLDAVRLGAVKLLLEEKRRSDAPLEPSVRRVQYGVVLAEPMVLLRWAEDNAGQWHRTEFTLPTAAAKALFAALNK